MNKLDEIEAALAARKTRSDGPRIVTGAHPCRPPVAAAVDAMPPHHCYVEIGDPVLPLFVAKPPSSIEVVNDATRRFADFFATLRDPKRLGALVSRHKRFGSDTPPLGILFAALDLDPRRDEKMYVWFRFLLELDKIRRCGEARTCLFPEQASLQTWPEKEAGFKRLYSIFRRIDSRLPDLHGRLMRIQYESRETAEKMVELYDAKDTLFFAYDPDGLTVKLLQRTNGAVLLVGPEQKLPRAFRRRATSNGDGVWVKHGN